MQSIQHQPRRRSRHRHRATREGLRPEPASDGTHARTVRDFAHPQLKLIRLLHEAAEIEHALMAQYRHLSGDFPIGQHAETIAMLDADVVALLPGTEPHR